MQKTTKDKNNHQLFTACLKITACRAEVKVRMHLPQDTARPAQCPCATLMRVTFKTQSPAKLQLRLISRLRKFHCVVVKNQGLIAALITDM
jgi:hypothetical protein